MSKIKNWVQEKLFWVQTGHKLSIINDGEAVENIVIRYNDLYLCVTLDAESKEPTGDFTWSKDGTMFPDVLVRDYLTAKKKGK